MAAIVLLSVFSPLIVLVTLILAFVNGGKPFFVQRRTGKNGRLFSIIKFKTMNDRRDKSGALLPDVDRIHALGRFVRNYSLDELPQLFNVLKGDMSLVGPRPLLPEYLPLYSPEQSRRHLVKPGITGWAQVNGRNALSWAEKFRLDCWYVDHVDFALDMRILWLTVMKVFRPSGVNASSAQTMERFKGNNFPNDVER